MTSWDKATIATEISSDAPQHICCAGLNTETTFSSALDLQASMSHAAAACNNRCERDLLTRLASIFKGSPENVCLIDEGSGRLKWIQPSGACTAAACQCHTCRVLGYRLLQLLDRQWQYSMLLEFQVIVNTSVHGTTSFTF